MVITQSKPLLALLLFTFCSSFSCNKRGVVPAPQKEHEQQQVAKPSSSPPTAESKVSIAPYLVAMEPTSVRLAWRSRQEKPFDLKLVNLEDGTQETFHFDSARQHLADMGNLTPGTRYRWTLTFTTTVDAATIGEFTTPPDSQRREFAVVGHTHGSENFGHYPDTLLASTIESYKPQFLIHTGDCVYFSTPSNWKVNFFELFGSLLKRAPIYVAPGNHDSGWPFIDGLDLRPFKELFQHDYPEECKDSIGAAFYDRIEGPVHFLFLSYVSDLGENSLQYRWISRTLESSTSEFRVVVLGGMNNYYDKQGLQDLLNSKRVDAVLRGDGAAAKEIYSKPKNYPIFTVGSGGFSSPPWISVVATPEHMVFLEMNASGKTGRTHWIHSQRKRAVVFSLPQPKVVGSNGARRLTFVLPPGISSDKVQGIQFVVEGVPKNPIAYYTMSRPKDKLGRGEVGFRSQYGFLPRDGGLVTVPIGSERPIRGGTYDITLISLKLSGKTLGKRLKITDFWLY